MATARTPKPLRIYVAGPLTLGDVGDNIHQALMVGNLIRSMGAYPFVPHLFFFWNMMFRKPENEWINLDLVWLETCDAVFRLEGESNGAEIEVNHAKSLGIPVFYSIGDLKDFIEKSRELT